MPRFILRGLDQISIYFERQVEAKDKATAIREAEDSGLKLIDVTELPPEPPKPDRAPKPR